MNSSKKKGKLKSFDENAGMHLNKVKIIILILIILIAVFFCAVRFLPIFSVKNIEVRGNEIVSKDSIIDLCSINYDSNLYGINKNYSIGLLKSNAYIENASISRKLPSTVIIEVEERKPLFAIQKDANFYYIDMHGTVLDIRQDVQNLPTVEGLQTDLIDIKTGGKLSKEDSDKLNLVYKIIEMSKTKQIEGLISKIDVTDANNCKIVLASQNKIAYIGNGLELDIRLDYLKAILAQEAENMGSIFVNMDLNKGKAYFREEDISSLIIEPVVESAPEQIEEPTEEEPESVEVTEEAEE